MRRFGTGVTSNKQLIMTKTETETYADGIGLTTLQTRPSSEFNERTPISVHGVAIPENTVLQGGQGVPHFYPPELLERAADLLNDAEAVNIVKDFHELEGQAPASAVIGEVNHWGYQQGIGLVFEGEILDEDIAQRIAQGYLDVSPSTARGLGSLDEVMEAREVTEFGGMRDLAVVQRGQPGATVEVGANPSIEALSLDALSRAFEIDTLAVSEPEFTGYDESAWDAPTLEDTFDGDMESARNSATWIENDGENFEDLSLFVLNGEGELNVNALDSAWRLASQTDGPSESDVERLRSMYMGMAEEANDAGAITDAEFDSVWQDRVADTDTNGFDTMSKNELITAVAEEYDVSLGAVESALDSLNEQEEQERNGGEGEGETLVLVEGD